MSAALILPIYSDGTGEDRVAVYRDAVRRRVAELATTRRVLLSWLAEAEAERDEAADEMIAAIDQHEVAVANVTAIADQLFRNLRALERLDALMVARAIAASEGIE